MLRRRQMLGAGGVLGLAVTGNVFGQFQNLNPARSIQVGSGYEENSLFETFKTDSTSAVGPYSNNLSTVVANQIATSGPDSATVNINTSAGQTSMVTGTLLSGTGSAYAAASITPILGTAWDANASGQSVFSVQFTVPSPTLLSLSGDLNGTAEYHVGVLDLSTASLMLGIVGQGSPLYSVTGTAPNPIIGPDNFDDPVSFSTTLQPGFTYQLSASAAVDTPREGDNIYDYTPANSNFSFSASVPEPGPILLLSASAFFLMRPGRRESDVGLQKPAPSGYPPRE